MTTDKRLTNCTALQSRIIHIILLLVCALQANAWEWWPLPMAESDTCRDSLLYVGSIHAVSSSGAEAPSLLWHNSYGGISVMPHSATISLGVIKPATRPSRWFDYDFGVVLDGRFGGGTSSMKPDITGFFQQLYAHTRLYIVDITAGIKPEYYGAGDAMLSSGSLLFSNNAHPIPRISIGFERWTPIPGLFGYAEIKGGLTHGWLNDNSGVVKGTLVHHKYIGGRIGGKLPVNLSYEFHHVAQWGGYSSVYGDLGNNWQAFKAAVLVKSGGTMANDQINAQGNHIGFQQLALDVKGEGWKVCAYWQIIQEDGPIRFIGTTMNKADGLWGISATQSRWPFIQGLTYEFLNTTDQSGPFHDRDGLVYGGADNYYSNSIYPQGWTYYGRMLGSPLLSLSNSRVMAHHVGVRGDIYGYRYRLIVNHADNYGRYSKPERSRNNAVLLELTKHVPQAWGLDFSLTLAGDFGTQYGNRFGAMLTITKTGLLTQW